MKKILFALALLICLAALLFLPQNKKTFTIGECPFCKETVMNQCFYESELALGILTYKPAVPGHVLVIPKRHVERFEDLTVEEMNEIQVVIRKINAAEIKIFKNSSYLLLQKNGEASGQSVPHLHFHYLPRDEKVNHVLFSLRWIVSPYFKPLTPEQLRDGALALKAEIDRIPDSPSLESR